MIPCQGDDGVGARAFPRIERLELTATQAREPVIRADPEAVVAVDVEGVDVRVGEAASNGVVRELPVMEPAEARGRADPERAVPTLLETGYEITREPPLKVPDHSAPSRSSCRHTT